MSNESRNKTDYISFYDGRRSETYKHDYEKFKAEDHPYFHLLKNFIDKYKLKEKKCLEIGSSGGYFQDLVNDYSGTDVAESLAKYYHKTYKVCNGGIYPFESNSFDAIWTITVYEHIPELQVALFEINRMLKLGGVLFFAPAWQCRSWAADGYEVRPYSDFSLRGKLIKASIPLRNSILWRSLYIFPIRTLNLLIYSLGFREKGIQYKKIKPNYDTYWVSDADACNHIDPFDAILWFRNNGFECLSHPTLFSSFFVRNGVLIFKKYINR
jgi:SAM-dependent methyltransferase